MKPEIYNPIPTDKMQPVGFGGGRVLLTINNLGGFEDIYISLNRTSKTIVAAGMLQTIHGDIEELYISYVSSWSDGELSVVIEEIL